MRIGYADPPYPGQSKKHYEHHPDYAGEVDHADLIARLERDYDGWVLHTSSTDGLKVCVPMLPSGARVMAWFKPFAAFKRNVSVAYAWEPVIIKACRKPVVRHRVVMRDFIEDEAVKESITMKKGLTGVKPPKVCWWAFEMVGAEPEDELDDLYPGTGAVSAAWEAWRADKRGDDVMPTIAEKIEAARERARKAEETVRALEAKAAAGDTRTHDRSVTQIREIMLLDEKLKKTYGAGFAGLASVVRKAKKDGIKPVVATGQKVEEEYISEVRILEPGEERNPNAALAGVTAPREHHGDGDEPLAVEPEPEPAAAPAEEPAEEPMPW